MIIKLLVRSMPTMLALVVLAIPTQGDEKMSQLESNKPDVKIELLPEQKGVSYRVDGAYIAKLKYKIENTWQKLGTRRAVDPEVKIKFLVHLGGELSNLRVESTSGKYDLDQIALKSVDRSAPFEKLSHLEDTKTSPTEVWFQATF